MRPLALLVCLACAQVGATDDVPYQRLLNTRSEPGNWLTYSGAYHAHRHSPLDEINTTNAAGLRLRWIYQFLDGGLVETSPIVAGDVMYITETPSRVSALDTKSGRRLWTYNRPMPGGLITIGYHSVNRGVAVLDDKVFIGTLDAWIVALDAASGAPRWETQLAENRTGHGVTSAPLAIDGKVIVGIAGGAAGIRGFLDAYDAETGERLWRCWTVPAPGEPGNETWGDDSWKRGGGAPWLTGSYDPELNLLYWGTGNPAPLFNGDVRPGDNLYTCSLLAIDPDSGKIQWYFQLTPHNVHDWDNGQIPVLIDTEYEGRERKLVAMANRNAFYYVLDRETGEFLHASAFAKQTWAKSIDDNGRPVVLPDTEPTREGTLIWPSMQGGTNWFSPSYSPLTRFFYVAVRERGAYYYKSDAVYNVGRPYAAGGERGVSPHETYGAVRALDAVTGERQWEFRTPSPSWAGVMSTAGGLVFAGSSEGSFFALDAATGEPLWDFQTGGPITANPTSFHIDGRQHVAIAAGHALLVFGLPQTSFRPPENQ